MDSVQCIKSWDGLRRKKENTKQHTGCCRYEFTNSDLWILGFGATLRIRQGSQDGRHTGQGHQEKTNTRRGSGRYRSSSIAPDSIQFFFLWYEELVLNSLIFVEILSNCPWPSSVNPSRSYWLLVCCCFQMLHFVMLAKRSVVAELLLYSKSSSHLLLILWWWLCLHFSFCHSFTVFV